MMKRAWNLDCDPSPIEGPCPLYCDWTVAGYWPTTWDVDSTEASLDGNQQNHVAEGEAKGSLNEEHRSDVRLSVIVGIHKKKLFNQLAPHKKKDKTKKLLREWGLRSCCQFRMSSVPNKCTRNKLKNWRSLGRRRCQRFESNLVGCPDTFSLDPCSSQLHILNFK